MQFRDLHAQYEALKKEIDEGIQEVLDSSGFILGKKVTELEEELASYVNRKYCVSCGNGTDALQLSLMAMDIGPGDAVFTSDFTYFASAGCASILGATPILVDIDIPSGDTSGDDISGNSISSYNISPDDLEKAIKRVLAEGKLKPKVIIPVDLFGLPADYSRIEAIAEKYHLKILEDAAQGFGGDINGKRACSYGEMSATSFFPAKPLGCYGDGGAIFTDERDVAKRLKSLRAQGKSPTDKYDNREIGMNSRLDTLQAAILLPKLKAFFEYELGAVNQAAKWYTERLRDVVIVPNVPQGFYSSWAQYTILCEDSGQRERIQTALREQDIPSMIYYPRGLHQQEAYRDRQLPDAWYPNTLEAAKRVLSLPMHPYMKESDVDMIAQAVRKAI